MKAWWHGLADRERRLLVAGALVVLVAIGYGLLWEPLAQRRTALREQVAQAEADLAWMRQAAPALAGGAAQTPVLERDNRSLLARVDAGAREAGLGGSLLRVEPVAEGEVRVYFQGAAFDTLIGWLDAFAAAQGVQVRELSVQRATGSGLVDARLALVETAP